MKFNVTTDQQRSYPSFPDIGSQLVIAESISQTTTGRGVDYHFHARVSAFNMAERWAPN
jgi:hypothetical protein